MVSRDIKIKHPSTSLKIPQQNLRVVLSKQVGFELQKGKAGDWQQEMATLLAKSLCSEMHKK